MKKVFLVWLVLIVASAQVVFAADGQRKGFSFYSKSKAANTAESKEVVEPVKEAVTEPVAEKVEEKIVEKAEEIVAPKAEEPVVEPVAEPVDEVVAEKVEEKVEAKVVEKVEEKVEQKVEEKVDEKVAQKVEEKVTPVAAQVVPTEDKRQANVTALLQRLANNKSLKDEEKTALAETMIAQHPNVDFRDASQEKVVLFFEATGNDPNMTVQQKKDALKKGIVEKVEPALTPAVADKAVETPKEQEAPKAAKKEEPKKFKFF